VKKNLVGENASDSEEINEESDRSLNSESEDG